MIEENTPERPIPRKDTPIYDQLRYEYYVQEDLDSWFGTPPTGKAP